MAGLPALLNLSGRRCVIVGGGGVAARRAAALREAGAEVRVVAPRVDPRLAEMGVEIERRGFAERDLDGVFLAVICTDDDEVNRRAAALAAERGVLTNRADDPEAGDVVVPAHRRLGPITVAVDSGGTSAAAAAKLRDAAARAIDPTWPELLERARPWRAEVQRRFAAEPAQRTALLRSLTDARAMAILEHGGGDALDRHWRSILDRAEASPGERRRAADDRPPDE